MVFIGPEPVNTGTHQLKLLDALCLCSGPVVVLVKFEDFPPSPDQTRRGTKRGIQRASNRGPPKTRNTTCFIKTCWQTVLFKVFPCLLTIQPTNMESTRRPLERKTVFLFFVGWEGRFLSCFSAAASKRSRLECHRSSIFFGAQFWQESYVCFEATDQVPRLPSKT